MPISVMQTSVSGSMPAERERHAELVVVVPLRRDRARVRRAERGEDVLRRRLAGGAGDRDDARAATGRAPRRRSSRAPRAGGRERASRRRRARARAARSRRRPCRPATNRSPSSIRRESICTPVTSVAHGCACTRPSGSISSSSSGIIGGPRRAASVSRATSRSSNGIFPEASSCSGSAPRPAITTTSPGLRLGERELDRGAAVELDLEPAERAGGDLGGDRGRILAARVVGGEDRAVGELGDDAAHQRPLRPVAVAARAEDDDEPSLAQLARPRAQHVLERVRRVRVVDDAR